MSANPHDAYNHCCCPKNAKAKSSPGILGILTRVVVTYLVLVLAGGTMINTGHPVAMEAGELLHTVLLVEPLTYWTADHSMGYIAHGIQFLADGVPVQRFLA